MHPSLSPFRDSHMGPSSSQTLCVHSFDLHNPTYGFPLPFLGPPLNTLDRHVWSRQPLHVSADPRVRNRSRLDAPLWTARPFGAKVGLYRDEGGDARLSPSDVLRHRKGREGVHLGESTN